MIVNFLPHEGHLCLRMTSRTMYTLLPNLPSMTREENLNMHRQFEAVMYRRRLLHIVCTGCTKLLGPTEFSDKERKLPRRSPGDHRRCISCVLSASGLNYTSSFLYGGVMAFGCYGCKKGLPLVCSSRENLLFDLADEDLSRTKKCGRKKELANFDVRVKRRR